MIILHTFLLSEESNANVVYQGMLALQGGDLQQRNKTYGSISWIAYPMLTPGRKVLGTDVKIKLRVSKEYKDFCSNRR